jgi:hypothetical protein
MANVCRAGSQEPQTAYQTPLRSGSARVTRAPVVQNAGRSPGSSMSAIPLSAAASHAVISGCTPVSARG